MSVTYTGIRDEDGGGTVLKQIDNLPPRTLDPRADLRDYGGELDWDHEAGQLQLSIALLADVMGDFYAENYHEELRFQVVSEIPWEGFRVTAEALEKWILDLEQREKDGLPF
jgi:hypothetical protein